MQEVTQIVPSPDGAAPFAAIAGLTRLLTEAPSQEARLVAIARFCQAQFGVAEAAFWPIGRNLTDMNERPGKGQGAFLEYVARLSSPVIVGADEAENLAVRQSLPPLLSDARLKTFVLAPVVNPGRAVGVLALATTDEREFTEAEVERLQLVVAQIAAVHDALALAEENNYKDAYSRALGEIDTMIASHDVAGILRFGVRKVYETIEAERVLVFIVSPDSGVVRLSAAEGCPYAREGSLVHEPCARLAMHALKSRALQNFGEAELANLAGARPREACTEKQAIAAPIMANNHLFGVLAVFEKKNGRPFHRNEVAFINQVASKLALVIQNAQAYLTINRLNESLEQKVRDRTSQLETAITSLKDTQAQLMQSEKLATIGTLAGGVAHELNNPLAAILANIQLLKLDADDPEIVDSYALIETGARRCKQIVESLLNYSRQSSPEHRALSLNQVIEETLGLLAHELRLADVAIARDFAELPPILGNANELSQVFTNLVVNARDAIAERPDPSVPGRIAIRTYQEGKRVIAEFADNGPGLDEQTVRKIFDPFFTTKQIGKGTGLGLSVSQQIASAHGGQIDVLPSSGAGAVFRVSLPVAYGAERV